jgi:hypothetical protein
MENQTRLLAEVLRDEMVMQRPILALLQKAPMTVPQVAEALGKPEREVMLWMAAMWRYGLVAETGKANRDGYFSYQPRR